MVRQWCLERGCTQAAVAQGQKVQGRGKDREGAAEDRVGDGEPLFHSKERKGAEDGSGLQQLALCNVPMKLPSIGLEAQAGTSA